MKKLLVSLVSLTFFLAIGCEDDSVLESTIPVRKMEKLNSETSLTFNLCCALSDPTGGCCQITGRIEYQHQATPVPEEQKGLYKITLSLSINAELHRQDGMIGYGWDITNKSLDVIYISEEGIYILPKMYLIEHRMDIVLIVQYLLTTDGVQLSRMWLQEID